MGIKELILISQDTTRYGDDLKTHMKLSYLLRGLCDIAREFWIRLLYCHPAHFSSELIYTMGDDEKILHYVDLPIQHCSDRILSSMGRGYGKKDIVRLVEELRKDLKDVVLRTTVIVGYPEETDEDFEELLELWKMLVLIILERSFTLLKKELKPSL